MTVRVIRAATLDYDHVVPLMLGRVPTPGIDLQVRTDLNIRAAMADPDVELVEVSWSRHLQGLALGDLSWVALPIAPRRAFCHRTWFVTADSAAQNFTDLDDRPIGITEYPATGNTWARAAAREAGFDVDGRRWVVASFDGGARGTDTDLPPNVESLPADIHLLDLLLAGEISAVVCQLPPTGFYERPTGVRRLFADYSASERGYFERTGVFPGHHVLAVRRSFFDRNAWTLGPVLDAFQASRRMWEAVRLKHGDTSPWVMSDLEAAMGLMGNDWQAYGSGPLRTVTEHLCDELVACGLTSTRVNPDTVFAEFDDVVDTEQVGVSATAVAGA